eukprot:s2767_g4.t1
MPPRDGDVSRGIWLGKTISNDVLLLAVPGHPQVFVTRYFRRLANAWDMQMIAEIEACPWQFGYASLGSQLVLAKRIAAPPILSLPPAKPCDLDGEAVMNLPPTPDESASAAPSTPRMVRPPTTSARGLLLSSPTAEPAPVTPPLQVQFLLHDAAMPTTTSGASHGRDADDDGGGERPSRRQRVVAVFEREDDLHATFFEESEIEGLETYDYSLADEHDKDMNTFLCDFAVSSDDMTC